MSGFVGRIGTVLIGSVFALYPLSAAQASAKFTPQQPQFVAGQWPDRSTDLCQVATETLKYIDKGQSYDPVAIHGGKIPGATVPVADIRATLLYICQIANEDQAAGRKSRLTDPNFVRQHFSFVRWMPDQAGAAKLSKNKPLLQNLPADKILQTKYFVKIADGSPVKTAEKNQALYGLPFDEAKLDLATADALGKQITRFQLGKQDIVRGALEKTPLRAPVLFWLSREGLEGALLQGTAVVPSGQGYRYYNVHRTNGIPYDRTKTPEQQQRYWYFKQVQSVLGYGKDADYKIPIKPEVTVAGDIPQLGLGKLILLATPEAGVMHYRLTILADTGGAFANNLFQLDWLSGYYRGWPDYFAANKHRGDYSQAYLLLKK
ncbi:hypothetical protein [Rheinheimera sp.]|uniref:hypothetical protein n=1 Tax=Rheinheimera sp. TaxID=1869214 RepID=UPI003D2CD28D